MTINTKVCAENNLKHRTIIQSHNVTQGATAKEMYLGQQGSTCMRLYTEDSHRTIEEAGKYSKERKKEQSSFLSQLLLLIQAPEQQYNK